MKDLSLATLEAGRTTISAGAILALAGRLRGRLLEESDPSYDNARRIWNGMIDRRPGLIAQCAGAADAAAAVRFVRDHGLLVSVRAGGHNIAGAAVCDGGVVIDLSPMKSVRVDLAEGQAWVEPGATLGDVDRETQAFGLALPTGINSTTGIAGLTLGGGFGWLSRKFGLTIDNLLAADVVLADGECVRASPTEHPDLFWALRGGGGNFGVVTAFRFQLHPLGPQVLAGLVAHPLDEAGKVLRAYRQALERASDELTCWAVLRQAPPLPFLPPEWHGGKALFFALCYCGEAGGAQAATAGLRSIGRPIADAVAPVAFVDWQRAFDPLLAPGARNYWKSHDFTDLPDAAIDRLVEAARDLPDPQCEIFLGHVGGAVGRVAAEASAFPQRSAHFVMNVHARWRDAAKDRTCIAWARRFFEAMKPYAAGTAYVNFMPADESERVEVAYGCNYQRLAAVKRRYDPHNMFRMNQNVRPAEERKTA